MQNWKNHNKNQIFIKKIEIIVQNSTFLVKFS